MDPELSPGVRTWVARAVVGAAAIAGLIALAVALGAWIALAMAGVAFLAAAPRIAGPALRIAGAALVAALTLLGFNVFTDALGIDPPILLGLGVALIVFGVAAFWYLRGGFNRPVALVLATVLSVAFIVVLPIAIGQQREAESRAVAGAEPVASKLDVLLVVDAGMREPPPALAPDPTLRGFDVRYAIGFADGESVRWALTATDDEHEARAAIAAGPPASANAAPVIRFGADPVLLLVVDGTPPAVEDASALANVSGKPGEVTRWRRIAAASAPAGTPAYALLQTTNRARLRRWERFRSPGGAVSVQALASQTLTDAGARLAIAAPTSREDYALARKHRPILLFDRREPYPLPLSVQTLFDESRVSLCRDRGVKTDCQVVRDPKLLENGNTHLQLRAPRPGEPEPALQGGDGDGIQRLVSEGPPGAPPPGTPPPSTQPEGEAPGSRTAIYVHPVPIERDGRRLLYLDYWWYLPQNPTGAGGGGFCGAGLVIPGVTCFDHESDWEGVTVVVDRTGRVPKPIAVQFAQHESVVRYDWERLRRSYSQDRRLAAFTATVSDAADRPLVFVARGTHASYPDLCRSACRQVPHPSREEQPHTGEKPWVGNDTGTCGQASCIQLIPTRAGGRSPALWNAFEGEWGERHCVLTYYCDSSSPPSAPGQQRRYEDPTRFTGTVNERGRFVR